MFGSQCKQHTGSEAKSCVYVVVVVLLVMRHVLYLQTRNLSQKTLVGSQTVKKVDCDLEFFAHFSQRVVQNRKLLKSYRRLKINCKTIRKIAKNKSY